jgi:small subunit ribosomal protein S7
MPRRESMPRRKVTKDPVYNDETVACFINRVMYDGEKSLAQSIFYDAMEIVRDKSGKDPIEVFDKALKNVMPVLEVRARRVGGATYQVPMEVRPERRVSLAMRWMIGYARQRSERTMEQRLAGEILDAFNGTGSSVKKKEDTHRMAEANRAFAHYRW